MSPPSSSPSRRWDSFRSIYVKCVVVMVLTTVTVAGTLTVSAYRQLQTMAVNEVVKQAHQTAGSVANSVVKPIRFKIVDKIDESLLLALEGSGDLGRAAMVIDPEGAELSRQGDEGAGFEAMTALAGEALSSGAVATSGGGRWIAQPVLAGPEGPVIGVVAMEWRLELAQTAVMRGSTNMVLVALAVFAVMMGLSLLLLRRFLGQPLAQLKGAVDRVAHGDYDTPVGLADRQDEVGKIAGHLEELLQELRVGRTAEAEQKQHMAQQVDVVERLGRALDDLAKGDLSQEIQTAFPSDYEALRGNYNRAVQNLSRAVADVADGAQNIFGNANQIVAGADELSQRTETQAATLEESAAALEAMVQGVKTAADNAARADETVAKTRDIAERNGSVMSSAIEAMGEIEKSSGKISEITSVIDDIAFQTNLLALNAGVEAARAGSSGKGFAVVASEVLGLAQRSAEAAQQIKDLILGSEDQVKQGVELVEAAGKALEDVLGKVSDVADMVNGIAQSASEQAEGLNEVNTGISNLDRVTQQNAAMVEETTAAAHMMRNDARALSALVDQFRTARAAAAPRSETRAA